MSIRTGGRCLRGALLAAFVAASVVRLAASELQPASTPSPQPTIVESGSILGITIGMPLREVRERLKPLREPVAGPLDVKEKMNQRVYWKLVGTDYDWIMAWANSDGKVTRIRAVLRPDRLRPFSEIGDLAKAKSSGPNVAVWDVMREHGSFRLTALGAEEHAVRISMLAFDPSLPTSEEPDNAAE